MTEELDGETMTALMRALMDVDRDDPGEDEAVERAVALFNYIYALGQIHERLRRRPQEPRALSEAGAPCLALPPPACARGSVAEKEQEKV